jgi:hypothetical protein
MYSPRVWNPIILLGLKPSALFGFSVARHAVTYHTYDGTLFQTSSRCAAITRVETRELDIHCMLAQANFVTKLEPCIHSCFETHHLLHTGSIHVTLVCFLLSNFLNHRKALRHLPLQPPSPIVTLHSSTRHGKWCQQCSYVVAGQAMLLHCYRHCCCGYCGSPPPLCKIALSSSSVSKCHTIDSPKAMLSAGSGSLPTRRRAASRRQYT